jgi:hypothetical protein
VEDSLKVTKPKSKRAPGPLISAWSRSPVAPAGTVIDVSCSVPQIWLVVSVVGAGGGGAVVKVWLSPLLVPPGPVATSR